MTLPDSLQERLEAWAARGYILRYEHGVFLPPSWVAVMVGQNLMPSGYDPRANKLPLEALKRSMEKIAAESRAAVEATPDHGRFLAAYGASMDQDASGKMMEPAQ